jgi:hypothetical protein
MWNIYKILLLENIRRIGYETLSVSCQSSVDAKIYLTLNVTKQKLHTIYVGHHYAQTSTNNLNKTCILLQTIEGKILYNQSNGEKIIPSCRNISEIHSKK